VNREDKRKAERVVRNVAEKAKKDMVDWLQTLDHDPTPFEMAAYKAGYLAGLNRFTS
jgi:hypothetical protein